MSTPHDYPTKRIAAGALLLDAHGRVLLVKPTYKPGWEIPGGIVEADESPREACARELREELGLEVPVGRLLCIEYRHASAADGDSLQMIFDGGVLSASQIGLLRIPNDELSEYSFVEIDAVGQFLVERLAGRVRAAAEAREPGTLVYMEQGERV